MHQAFMIGEESDTSLISLFLEAVTCLQLSLLLVKVDCVDLASSNLPLLEASLIFGSQSTNFKFYSQPINSWYG